MSKVVVAGGGIAGIACARELRAHGIEVEVRDRGRVVGGRMASRWIDGRIVDSGASYFTARGPDFLEIVDDWLTRGLVRPWTTRFPVIDGPSRTISAAMPGPLRYAAPRGIRSLVADLAARGGVRVSHSSPVTTVEPGPMVDGEPVDAVVLAMPDPQALRHLAPELHAERAALLGRAWTPVLALLAGWSTRRWSPIDGAFVHRDPTIEWIADDGRRRGDNAPVLVAHSTAQFAAGRLTDPPAAAPALTEALRRLLGIPVEPDWTYVQRWTFARPAAPREQTYFLGAARVGLAGDGWGEPRVESAWRSGTDLARAIISTLT
ncbi:NAD(P)/FAD-dependent oxidoreductase [Parafrankia sp. EUN1f]|uniref:NAD(P)/FAD-dependent oxidoreductase n=1 Tax=Parafrankia sp. EUN1f TaxID=102897 RepID=UPI0001C43B0A|nr:FAD-dependent oxidoreductase [Parafrankia sp. EUN1f]EFC82099.1 amine oxidase, flavin-containing [Parafrankia sp. EUN1f]